MMSEATDQVLYLFFAIFDNEQAGQQVAREIARAAKDQRVNVDGLAAVHRDSHGRVHIHEIGDITGAQGTARGAVAGALLGLIFPPSVLATSIFTATVTGVIARLHDKGFATSDLKDLGEALDKGESAAIFIGDETTRTRFEPELKGAKSVEQKTVAPEVQAEVTRAGDAASSSESPR